MTLTILVSIFLVLLGAGLLVFATFFIINKIFLNKLTKLMKRYNKLAGAIHSINFFKIEVLIKNELPIKIDLDNLKKIYSDLSINAKKIYDNLFVITEEVNVMNLKTASDHLKTTDVDLTKAEQDLLKIKKQYDKYTSYGDAIDNFVQVYAEIYESLYAFYESKIKYNKYFQPLNNLFSLISQSLSDISNSKDKFDYKKTINKLLDLKKKLIALVKGLEAVLKFQIVLTYLEDSRDGASKLIEQYARDIDPKDFQSIKRSIKSFDELYALFKRSYLNFDFNSAQKYAISASEIAQQINNFNYIHCNTQNLIDISLQEIDKQTVAILSNKDKINNSLHTLSKYFIKDTKVSKVFSQIAIEIGNIDKLASSSKAITSKTYSQKLDALSQIATISKAIYDKKELVANSIKYINHTLSKIIQIVTELNDLYIYFYQLLSLIKKISPDDEQTKDIEALINNNLELLNSYARMIIEQEHPDYDLISTNVINMNDNVKQLSNRLKQNSLLKMYATKLMVYCNRFRGKKENAGTFATATKQYKAKEYSKCIETLLAFVKKNKSR